MRSPILFSIFSDNNLVCETKRDEELNRKFKSITFHNLKSVQTPE